MATVPVDVEADRQIRACAHVLLEGFAAGPLMDISERDSQARLLELLRSVLAPPDVGIRFLWKGAARRHQHAHPLRTLRVHAELKLDGKPRDVVVFRRDRDVELTLEAAGTFDAIDVVSADDLAAVIEIKSAPSFGEHESFREDLRRLSELTDAFPHLVGHFIAIDRSLHIAGASSQRGARDDWIDILLEDDAGRVEAHWVDGKGEVRSRRGTVRG